MTGRIHSLFPVPIYVKEIDREFTKKELKFIKDQEKHCMANEGNRNTSDYYILKRKELKNIRKFIEQSCQEYLDNVISPANDIKFYITESWLNYTREDQYHHVHSHPNSIMSGVLYIDSDQDSIKFTTPHGYKRLKPQVKNFNVWNSDTWNFPVNTGQLIMFPSETIHQVDRKKGKNVRTSLAFNTFYRGVIGEGPGLTELVLK
jgi:uncharacterized protein (TIGR02466 family)|tara:strand:+ start:657 stop:1268 length:612 start_codon:yes stop_codon:yes gene_type:complete